MKQEEDQLRTNSNSPLYNDEQFQIFLNSSHLAIINLNKDRVLQYVTPLITAITGITAQNCGEDIRTLPYSEQNPDFIAKIEEFILFISNKELIKKRNKWNNLERYHMELDLIGNNQISYQMVIHAYSSSDHKVNGIIIIFYDITTRKSIEMVLENEKEKYRLIAELTDSALWEYDIKKKILKQYRKLKGKNLENQPYVNDYRRTSIKKGWIHPEDISIFEAYCDSMDQGDDIINYEFRGLNDNGEYIWLRYQGTALKDKSGKVLSIMGRTINIDREYKDREKLIRKTERDPLTGLNNRASTKEKAEKCFERIVTKKSQERHAYLIIDIDNFKQANDQWGHLFGDILLETFSEKLENIFDSTDIVGRIGGDEFVVIQKDIPSPEYVEKYANEVCEIAKKHLNVTKMNTEITVSIGIALFPMDGKNYDTLYRRADVALYAAKSKGKDQYAFYRPEMEHGHKHAEIEKKNWISAQLLDMNSPEIEKRLINFAFDIVNESNDLEYAIKHILSEIGNFYELSRIIVFENSNGSMDAHVSHEWLNSGITSIAELPVKEAYSQLLEYEELFYQNGIFYFEDVDNLNVSRDLKKFYEAMGMKALLQCPIFDGNKFLGTISFEDCITIRKWSKTEFDTLYTLTKLIGSYIIQLESKKELDIEVFFTQETLNNQKLSNYAIKEDTYELLYFSKYTKKLYPDAKLGELCYKVIYHRENPCEDCPLNGLDENNLINSVDTYNEVRDAWFSTTASIVTIPSGEKIKLICSSDVTGFIERVSSKDSLTGLLTLTKFEVDTMKLITSSPSIKYMIIYTDFDKFKNINAEWGYSTGNDILIQYTNAVNKYIKPTELFCRITSDKFLLMLSYRNKKGSLDRINVAYRRVEEELLNRFPCINLVMTSGIYFLKQEDKNISIAIDKANIARKTIKGIHKSEYAIYDETLHQQITKEILIASKMHRALKKNEFEVYMQPKVDLKTLKIIGAEALVRWKLPSGEILSPGEFIPIFEKNGFIDELDFYVYESTLRALRQWMDLGKQELVISVNVSRIHLKDGRFLERLDKLMEMYRIPSRLIELEITESMFFVELEQIEYILKNLRKRGFQISIDDFGSGYSSLNMLKTLPVDILKLDREFFMKNEMGSSDKIVISGIISLAKGLGLKVISEGVETTEQLSFLKESLCDMAQGYLFYKPMPMDEFMQLIE